MARLHELQHLQPVQPAALQPDVEEDQVRPSRLHRRERLIRVARGARAEALILEDARDEIADVGLVVDDQDIRTHDVIVPSLGLIRRSGHNILDKDMLNLLIRRVFPPL